MENKKTLYQAAFGASDAMQQIAGLKQETVKTLYSELFLQSTSKSRRERLARGKVIAKQPSATIFDEENYLKACSINTSALLKYQYSSKLSRVCRAIASNFLFPLFNNIGAIQKDIKLVQDSRFFDAQWYAKTYGLVGTPEQLAKHFLLEGYAKLNDPSPHFSTQFYLSTHTDVVSTPINPLIHYLIYGMKEKRKIATRDKVKSL
jgi:hypothetical protein